MNILYVPQLSMYNKQTKEFIPEADGNINMMRNTINEWHKYKPYDKFFVLLPDEVYGIKGFEYTPILYFQYVISARINRFNFPMQEITDCIHSKIKGEKIDLVITDVIELAKNIKSMFSVEFGYTPKIISNIRHVDELDSDNLEYDYTLRVIDGIQCSDLVTILSDSMKFMIYNSMRFYLNEHICDSMYSKIHTFEPSISYNELKEYYEKIEPNDVKIITFPGRLSKGEEKRTNWDKFRDAILKLREQRQDFIVYFTDPNNATTDKLRNGAYEWIKFIAKDRSQFLNLLNNTDIIVSLMDIQGFGGIAIREALIFDCAPLIPFKHEYCKMMPENYNGFIKGDITVDKIIDKLNFLIDNCNNIDKQLINKNSKQFTIEYQFKNILEKINNLLGD